MSTLVDSHAAQEQRIYSDYLILLDWDDTLCPSTYIISTIDCELDERCGKISSFEIKQELKNEFVCNLKKVGSAALKLLNKLLCRFKATNIKIVTNGQKGWLSDSLVIAGSFCSEYVQIKKALIKHQIEIIYARNSKISHNLWKRRAYDLILSQFDLNKQYFHILTIGDQWTDHSSIKSSFSFASFGHNLCHHQIKLHELPDCRYMGIELKCIISLIEEHILMMNNKNGVILEFDGYDE